jgi:hypothetical protein
MKITILSYEETKERLRKEPFRIYSPQRFKPTATASHENTDGNTPSKKEDSSKTKK